MEQAPPSSLIAYWLRPSAQRKHIHRIEVEHALYLANSSQAQIKETLTEMLRRQTSSLGDIATSLNELQDVIVAGFTGVAEGLGRIDSTLHGGFYQVHLDALGTQAILNDILSCLVDKEAFKRELARREAVAAAARARYAASGIYSDAMTLARGALNENDRGKAGAMLDEAILLFGRAATHEEFSLDAHFQLGYLAHMQSGDIAAAYSHFEKALGPAYSPHYVRTARYLAHLDYLRGRPGAGLERLHDIIQHDETITAFSNALANVNLQPWPNCQEVLQNTLDDFQALLGRCGHFYTVRGLFADGRRYSATQRFMESFDLIRSELHSLRPDPRVYYEAARYGIRSGVARDLALPWIRHCCAILPSMNARRAFLIESMSDPDLRDA